MPCRFCIKECQTGQFQARPAQSLGFSTQKWTTPPKKLARSWPKGTIFGGQFLKRISPASTIPGTRVTFQLKSRPTVTLTCQNCVSPQAPGCILTSILPFLPFFTHFYHFYHFYCIFLPFLPFSAERKHFLHSIHIFFLLYKTCRFDTRAKRDALQKHKYDHFMGAHFSERCTPSSSNHQMVFLVGVGLLQ